MGRTFVLPRDNIPADSSDGVRTSNGAVMAQTKDASSGALLKSIFYMGSAWNALCLAVVPDLSQMR